MTAPQALPDLRLAICRWHMLGYVRGQTLVFFDGLCGLCDRFVQFLVPRDHLGALRFAPLQSRLAGRELIPRGYDPADLDSVFVIAGWGTPEQRVLTRSRAVLHAVASLGGAWAFAARVVRIVPTVLADRVYAFVARRRYRIFGKYSACPLPRPEWRDRFLSNDETNPSSDRPIDRSSDLSIDR